LPEHLKIEFITRDVKGKVLSRVEHECHSFLTQYYQMMYVVTSPAYAVAGATQAINDTGAASRNFQVSAAAIRFFFCTQNGAASNVYGIQVGTGNAANTAATSGLQTLIADGVAATQLNYGAMGITVPSGSAPLSFTFTRTFTNNSGGTINVTEAGLVIAASDTAGTQRNVMIIRDTGFGTVAILDGANSTATYTLSYTIA
jgi:hypothetical protein